MVPAAEPRPDQSSVLRPGPWRHRDVGANGSRFHVAELGEGPLVLLLHGFPQFWWAWRDQLTGLAERGFRAVAVDLRGYGASDKPPRGYDAPTMAADIAGLVRALGEDSAVVVGHDWGGLLAWTLGAMHSPVVRRLVIVSQPHPLAMRAALVSRGPQLAASQYLLAFQAPWRPERHLVADGAASIGGLLHRWGGPGYPAPDVEAVYREQLRIPGVVHSAMEYYRWLARSQLRPDGARFAALMRRPVEVPTLQLHGTLDTCTLLSTATGNGSYVSGPYVMLRMQGVGHFPHEEAADDLTAHLAAWSAG